MTVRIAIVLQDKGRRYPSNHLISEVSLLVSCVSIAAASGDAPYWQAGQGIYGIYCDSASQCAYDIVLVIPNLYDFNAH